MKGVIWSKLKGKAREYVPTGATIKEIKEKLNKNIKVPSSKIISGRLMALKADKRNFGDYASKAEELAEQLKRAYISEDIPNERANQMTIDQTIELCASNTATFHGKPWSNNLRALIDTGSQLNLISLKATKRLGLRIYSAQANLIGVETTIRQSTGYVLISLNFPGIEQPYTDKFYVV